MKIGILTFTDGTNYGQRLQNYALQEVLCREGHEVFTIKQKHVYSKKHMAKEFVEGIVHREQRLKNQARVDAFEKFNNQYISFYENEIEENCYGNALLNDTFDMFIAGSDQIWNPHSPFVNSNFFMQFADKQKRATYAPSFSVDIIPESCCKNYASWISDIPSLSAREIQGVMTIKNLTGREAHLVVDPTMLLTTMEWNTICKRPNTVVIPDSPYALTLFLGEEYGDDIEYVQKKTGLQIATMKDFYSLAPDEFLWLLKNAELVLTDSYHVTIFSMIFSRPFIVFDRKSQGSSMSSRFETLDFYFNIKPRFWNYIKTDFQSWIKNDGIHFSDRIEELRSESLLYLSTVLKHNNK